MNDKPLHEIYLSGPELDRRHGISPVTRWRRIKSGALPKPVILAPGARPRFRLSEVIEAEKRAEQEREDTPHAA